MDAAEERDVKELRNFGVIVGAVFAVIGVWPLVMREQQPRMWAVIIAVPLILLGAVIPRSLRYPYRGWMTLSHALGWVNTRVLLGIIFFVVVTPLGLFMRLLGKDAMRRSIQRDSPTYRVEKVPRGRLHMKHQF